MHPPLPLPLPQSFSGKGLPYFIKTILHSQFQNLICCLCFCYDRISVEVCLTSFIGLVISFVVFVIVLSLIAPFSNKHHYGELQYWSQMICS